MQTPGHRRRPRRLRLCHPRRRQLGVDTVIVDESHLGGTCLNVGCIPSKALIHVADEFAKLAAYSATSPLGISVTDPAIDMAAAIAWKDGIVDRLRSGVGALLKKANVRTITGSARLRDGKTVIVKTADGEIRVRAENLVLATGSAPVELDHLKFGDAVLSSTDALALKHVPGRLTVVGAGYIGLEIGTAFAKLGSDVTIIEAEAHILPQYDSDLSRPIAKRLDELGVTVITDARAERLSDGVLTVAQASGDELTIETDKVLVTVGRRPRTHAILVDELDLTMSGPFIRIDDRCQTSMRGVYAIGDVTGEPMLAHHAMAQGEMVAEIIAGQKRAWDKACIPAVCFTDPEIVTVGLAPSEARDQGIEAATAVFPFAANGRAMTIERDDGFVRVTHRADNGVILGIAAVGPGIAELSSAFALAIEMGARIDDIAGVVHAHPTLSEGFHEACLKALGHALHI